MEGIVYIIDDNNLVINEFKMDWDTAINRYYGKRDRKGRYYIGVPGKPIPFKKKSNPTYDIKRQSKQ